TPAVTNSRTFPRKRRRAGSSVVGGGRGGVDPADVLHLDPVDFVDLGPEEFDQVVAAELDDELVDDLPVGPMDDVDGDDVPADGADAAGDLPEGPRAVEQADAHDEPVHGPKARPVR